jgi:hypothetical protein
VEGMMGCLNQFKWKIEINSPKRQVSWHYLMHVFKLLAFTHFAFVLFTVNFTSTIGTNQRRIISRCIPRFNKVTWIRIYV